MSTVDKELGFAELAEQLNTVHGIRQWGRVIQVVGNLIEAHAPTAPALPLRALCSAQNTTSPITPFEFN